MALTFGTISGRATQADAVGNAQTAAAATTSFVLDPVEPAEPAVAVASGGGHGTTTRESTPAGGASTLTGEAGDSISVTFTNGAHTLTKIVTGAGRSQALTSTHGELTTLANGTISVSATQTDAAGNAQTAAAATTSFVLDTVAPAAPALALWTGVANGETASDSSPARRSSDLTGEAGDSISVTFTNGAHTLTKIVT